MTHFSETDLSIFDNSLFLPEGHNAIAGSYNRVITAGQKNIISYYYMNSQLIGWSDDAEGNYFGVNTTGLDEREPGNKQFPL